MGEKRLKFSGQGERNETESKGAMIEPTLVGRAHYSHGNDPGPVKENEINTQQMA